MRKLLLGVFALSLLFSSTSLLATDDVRKGQKVYLKKLKSKCEFGGAKMATKHTQDEWKVIYENGNLNKEMSSECPKLIKPLKPKHEKQLFEFLYEYGSDSGNVPSCG